MRLRRPVAAALAAALAAPAAVTGLGRPAGAATPTDLFFSEYIEGSGFNKAIEIFNGTGAPVDLAAGGYTLELYSNGAGSPAQSVGLTGTVADGDVFVVSRADPDPALVAQTDQFAPAVANWNGDDAVALHKAGDLVDVIGQIGFDPGTEWGTGDTSAADNTIRRKPDIDAGDTNGADAFDPAAEWDGFPINTFDGFGAHTFTGGGGNQPVTVSCGGPLATVAGTAASRVITATDADGTSSTSPCRASAPYPPRARSSAPRSHPPPHPAAPPWPRSR